jgi:hypothetical protein
LFGKNLGFIKGIEKVSDRFVLVIDKRLMKVNGEGCRAIEKAAIETDSRFKVLRFCQKR